MIEWPYLIVAAVLGAAVWHVTAGLWARFLFKRWMRKLHEAGVQAEEIQATEDEYIVKIED
jgi:hypothetical protein